MCDSVHLNPPVLMEIYSFLQGMLMENQKSSKFD